MRTIERKILFNMQPPGFEKYIYVDFNETVLTAQVLANFIVEFITEIKI